jgi:hypothetical protein
MKPKNYQPEMGQMCFGNKWEDYEIPEYANALLQHLIEEMKRVYWNNKQELFNECQYTKINKVVYRPYYWGEDSRAKQKPNFYILGDKVQVFWYKHPGRGMSVNRKMSMKGWIDWFNRVLKRLWKADKSSR